MQSEQARESKTGTEREQNRKQKKKLGSKRISNRKSFATVARHQSTQPELQLQEGNKISQHLIGSDVLVNVLLNPIQPLTILHHRSDCRGRLRHL